MFASSLSAAPSPKQVLETYRTSYDALLAAGKIKPLIYPYHFFGVHLIILYLSIPHKKRPWIYRTKWVVFAVVAAYEVQALMEVRCMSMAVSYAAGLLHAWCIVWGATLLVWNKPQWEFKRVEILDERAKDSRKREPDEYRGTSSDRKEQEGVNNSTSEHLLRTKEAEKIGGNRHEAGYTNGTGSKDLRRKVPNKISNGEVSGLSLPGKLPRNLKSPTPGKDTGRDTASGAGELKFYWQSYPERNRPFRERLNWVLDVSMNFRGTGWNWAIPGLPPLPHYITSNLENPSSVASTKKLYENPSKTHTEPEMVSNPSIRKYNIIKFCIGYFVLDILKTILMHDPYFYLGPNDYALPVYFPTIITISPFLLRVYRSLLTFISVIVSVEMAFLFSPLFLNYLLGPSVLGLRGHDFMYPPIWGPFVPNVLDKGLGGLWGGWWHQTFRFAFSSPTSYFIKKGWIKKRSMMAKLVGLVVAFGISGFMHLCGSMNQFGGTNPLHPLAFFMLQGVGILVQTVFSSLFHGQIKLLPKFMRRIVNFLFTFTWLFYTCPLLIDDFASGGVWLYEPIPISLLRGLGFGTEGDSWWCWSLQHGKENGIGVGWYRGKGGKWWESGLAIY